jgi:hypothetical protein
MKYRLNSWVLGSLLIASPTLLMGADGNGCGGDVDVGSDECVIGGCSGTVCAEPGGSLDGTCEWFDYYACYQDVGICERGADGACGWRQSDELTTCIEENQPVDPPEDCVIGGCSGTLCGEPGDDLGGTCEWLDHYACYQEVGVCERDTAGACGWRQSEELLTCIEENQPVDPLLEACLAFCARASQCDGFMGCDQSCADGVALVRDKGCEDVYAAKLSCSENVDLCDLTVVHCPDEEAALVACLEGA